MLSDDIDSRTRRGGVRFALSTALILLWAYFVAVLMYGGSVGGVSLGRTASLIVVLLGGALGFVLAGRISQGRQQDLLAASTSLLFALLAADTVFAMWLNLRGAEAVSTEGRDDDRMSDPQIWHGEFYPRFYYPTDLNFYLFKPNVRVEATTYGEFYEPRMLKSPTLTKSVLRRRPLVYTIDKNGLRNRVTPGVSRIWTLGDSFAFGFSTTEGLTWVDRFAELTGKPVYNLGASGTGPTHQVYLLEHFLRREVARPERLLWMLFEGNDLENNIDEYRTPPESRSSSRAMLDDTILGDLLALPATIRDRSIVGRLRAGGLRFGRPGSRGADDPYLIDGVPLATPVYRSERWGACMFDPRDVDVATRDEAYVKSHPHRARLDRSFEDMKALAKEFGFRVTVLVAPSAPRVYGRDFPAMPQPSSEPHFIRYVDALAHRMGFETIDLLTPLSPGAGGAMLYYCDDHHWNERGNDAVAHILAATLDAESQHRP